MGGLERINSFIQDKGFYFEVTEADIDQDFQEAPSNDGRKTWYRVFAASDDLLVCVFGDWRTDERHWVRSREELSKKEQRCIKSFHKKIDEERNEKQLRAKVLAEQLWEKCKREAVAKNSNYLDNKKLTPSPDVLVVGGDTDNQLILVVPLYDETGEIWNIQKLYRAGGKYFNKLARTKGCFHKLSGTTETVYVGEGYATCRAVNQYTGSMVYVAFSASNLEAVVQCALREHRNVVLLADFDGANFVRSGTNTGMQACKELTLKYGLKVCVPQDQGPGVNVDFSDDWIDGRLELRAWGYEVLRDQVFKVEKIQKPKKQAEEAPEAKPFAEKEPNDNDEPFGDVVEPPLEPKQEWRRNYDEINPEIMPDRTKKGVVQGTLRNFQALMRFVGASLRYNVIKKEQEVMIPGEVLSIDNYNNALHGRIMDLCVRASYPRTEVDSYMAYLCDQKQFNPVVAWIESRPWDGVSRLEDLYSTITIRDESDKEAKRMKGVFIRKWMLIALAGAFKPSGVAAPGMLVLQGVQGSGKTAWFNALVPRELGLTAESKVLNPADKDLVKQTVCFWLVELGELNATFKKSELEGLKAFLTKQWDMFRAAYARHESKFPRRTVFFGSVNKKEFLIDETGNRRFWVLPTAKINYQHKLDMQQIWAELAVQFKKGAQWWLNAEEMEWLNQSNQEFQTIDTFEERLAAWGDWSEVVGDWKTSTQILLDLNLSHLSNSDAQKCANAVRKLNGNRCRRDKRGRYLWVPKRR